MVGGLVQGRVKVLRYDQRQKPQGKMTMTTAMGGRGWRTVEGGNSSSCCGGGGCGCGCGGG